MISNPSIEQRFPEPAEHTESPAPLSLHQLPPPPGDFTGRKKAIEELVESVRFDGASMVGIFGMGGIGKTALGLKLSEELISRYPDGQIFLTLRREGGEQLSPLEAMAHVIRSYEPGFAGDSPAVDIEGHYRSTLNGRRAIIFLDDAADAEQVKHLIPPTGCLLLITSWNSFALPGMLAVKLGPLTMQEARDLVLLVAPRLGNGAEHVAALCGCIPGALRKAGGMLVEHADLTVDDCMRRLSRAGERRSLVDASVAAVYDRLSPELRRVWRMLSVFPGKFDAAEAAEIWERDRETAEDFLSILLSCFMLEWEGQARGYMMHTLVRLCAENRCTDEERRSIGRRLAEQSVRLLASANALYVQGGEALRRGLALFDTHRLNIQAGWTWACGNAVHDEWAARLCARFPVVGTDILDIRQSPADRIAGLEAPLAAARRLKAFDEEGVILRDAGNASYCSGDIEHAIEYLMQALTVARESGDRVTEALTQSGLALAHARNGDFPLAVEHNEKAIALSRDIGDRRTECRTVAQAARTARIMNDPRDAMKLSEQALAIAGETGDTCAEARLLGDIAAASLATGKALRAIEVGCKSLHIASGIGDRLQEASVLDTLGKSYSAVGDSRRSIQSHEARLGISRELRDRYSEADALGNLGNACARSGDARRALAYHQELLSLVRTLDDRRGEATVLGNIGQAHLKLGETRVAVECQSERLAIAREIGDRRLEGSALWNMSIGLEKLGNRLQAISHAEAARKIFEAEGDAEALMIKGQMSQWTATPGSTSRIASTTVDRRK
jgi:tetratricopeptide (TPR) repeat protein